MTTNQTPAETVPINCDGLYRRRDGELSYIIRAEDEYHFADGRGCDAVDGSERPDWDLVELIAVAVPVQELAQLRRAQAACEAIVNGDNGSWDEWLEHRAGDGQ